MLVSDEQRAKLITNYNEGMKSTLEKDKINQASKETGLPVDKIKVTCTFLFIFNWHKIFDFPLPAYKVYKKK